MSKLKYIFANLLDMQYRRKAAMALILMFIVALVEVINISLIGPYLGILLSSDTERLEDFTNYLNLYIEFSNLTLTTEIISFILLSILLVSGALSYYANWTLSLTGFMLGHKINERLFHSYNNLPWEVAKDLDRDYLITLFGFDSLRFSNQVLLPILQLISKITLAILIFAMLLVFDFIIALSSITVFGLTYGFIIYSIRKRLVRNSSHITIHNQNRLTHLDQTMSGRKILTVNNKTKFFEADFSEASENHAKSLGDNTALSVAPRYIVETLLLILIITFITIASKISETGNVDLVTLTVFGIAGIKLMPIAQQIYAALVSIKSNFSTATSIIELHQTLLGPSITMHHQGTDTSLKKNFKSLRLEQCSLTNAQGKDLISDINLEIKAGQAIGIIGTSGSGKSTLLDCIIGLLQPTRGRIYLNDRLATRKLYQSIHCNYVNSIPYIFKQNLHQNITLEHDKANIDSTKKVNEIITTLRLEDLAVSERISRILSADKVSSGQAQRIGIARALYNTKADLFCLDEITSSLDGSSEQAVMDYFFDQIDSGKTCIIVAHRINTLKKCDRIIILDKGRIKEQGSYEELSQNSNLFNHLRNEQ